MGRCHERTHENLIAYNGSEYAEVVLNDLRRAGLPREAETLVLSVADVWLPTKAESETFGPWRVTYWRQRQESYRRPG